MAVRDYDKNLFRIEGTVLLRYNGDLAEVEIPYGVTEIADSAFQYAYDDFLDDGSAVRKEGSRNLQSVIIPPTVTKIGNDAFFSCDCLKKVVIPASVTKIGERLFVHCDALESVVVERGNLVYHSAENCIIETATKTLISGSLHCKIPADGSVTRIAEKSFVGVNFKKAEIPATIESIGEEAFTHSCMTALDIAGSVKIIPRECFYRCIGLETAVLHKGIEEIAERAFYDCKCLKNIALCEGLKIIGAKAFYTCENLEEITLPDTVEEIGDYAFFRCENLRKITLSKNLKHIGKLAFLRSHPEEIYIPPAVEYIGPQAFAGCRSLKKISIPQRCRVSDDALNHCHADLQIIRY